MNNQAALEQFKQVGVKNRILDANPHTLVAMLLDGLLERLARSRGCIERDERQQQGGWLGKSIAIVDSLRASLDHEQDGFPGLLSVVGVKYTTARDVAEKTVTLALKRLARGRRASQTAKTPVWGGAMNDPAVVVEEARRKHSTLDRQIVEHVRKRRPPGLHRQRGRCFDHHGREHLAGPRSHLVRRHRR